MKQDQKINLICRMAGNIMSGNSTVPIKGALKIAFGIFKEVEKRVLEEVSLNDAMDGGGNEKDD